MDHRRVLAVAAAAVLLALLGAPGVSLAHERRTLGGGKFDVVVGWETEPAFVNQRNAVGLRISKAGTNPAEPVLGVEKTLRVEVRQAGQTRGFELRTVFGQPGYYVANIVPTRAGDYVWTFTGTIGSDQITESFTSADGKFDPVLSSADVEFPIAAPDPERVTQELQTAEAAVRSAQLVGYLGVGLGLLGCLLALLLWLTRPRSRPTVLSSRDAAVRPVAGGGRIRSG